MNLQYNTSLINNYTRLFVVHNDNWNTFIYSDIFSIKVVALILNSGSTIQQNFVGIMYMHYITDQSYEVSTRRRPGSLDMALGQVASMQNLVEIHAIILDQSQMSIVFQCKFGPLREALFGVGGTRYEVSPFFLDVPTHQMAKL